MKSKNIIFSTLSVVFALTASTAFAAKPATLATCVGCHGTAGKSNNALWPNLAGQKEAYLAKQLRDFKTGKRADPMMTSIVLPLDEEDIVALAKYFSRQK